LDFVFEKVSEGEIKTINAKPVKMKELVRFGRYKKREESSIIRKEESIGTIHLKKILLRVQDNVHHGWKISKPVLHQYCKKVQFSHVKGEKRRFR